MPRADVSDLSGNQIKQGKEGGQVWLWVVVDALTVVFHIAPSVAARALVQNAAG
jgi:ribosomal silencing factor RsfS